MYPLSGPLASSTAPPSAVGAIVVANKELSILTITEDILRGVQGV
jgi:hypothetical protein